MGTFKNLTGQKFSRLIALEATERRSGTHVIWKCLCDCGNIKEIIGSKLVYGNTKSCGCFRREIKRIHGHTHHNSKSKTYTSWQNMKARCLDPQNKDYKDYGGRGITICERWLNSFENFLADMGERPINTTIDRSNSNGNYEPNNCRWATSKEQGKNKRKRSRLS